MSHIVKGKVAVAYVNEQHLLKALNGLGILTQHDKLYRVGAGYTSERYDYVLASEHDSTRRIGFNLVRGVWEQFEENFGTYGQWTREISTKIQDRYLAIHYEAELKNEGFTVTVTQKQDGTLELVAEEAAW